MRIVCISDTHGYEPDLPLGDLLVHCGDWSGHGGKSESIRFVQWMNRVKANYKYGVVVVPGNHERYVDNFLPDALELFDVPNVKLLVNETVIIDGIKIFGTPYTPTFFNWAFMGNESFLNSKFQAMQTGTDLVISHGPPYKILDWVERDENVGSYALAEAIDRVKPRVVVFGHIHAQYGVLEQRGVKYYNVAQVDEDYKIANLPVVIEIVRLDNSPT